MIISLDAITKLKELVGDDIAVRTLSYARKVDRLELFWIKKAEREIRKTTEEILIRARLIGRIDEELADFTDLIMEHSFQAMRLGFESAEKRKPAVRTTQLSSPPPKGRVPKSLRELRILWDQYRNALKIQKPVPPRQRNIAERLREAYLDKIQKSWRAFADDFLNGSESSQKEALSKMMGAADVAYARAKTIIATETTHYYNQVRRTVYDQSADVTHYLYMAIRDHRTTKWCKTRHGLVYAKTDPLLDKEDPPIHWNCRSEILPLSPLNPAHEKLIKDPARQRRNNSPAPLPQEFVGSSSRRSRK